MKSLSIVTFLILTCQICFGQASNKIDSLKAVIKSEIADTSKVWVYYELSGSPIPADEQLKYLQEGLTLAKKLNFVKGITLGTWQLAFKNNVLGNWAKGLEIALEGYNEALRTKNKADELSFMNMIALSYYKQRDYKTTLQWTKQSIEKLNNGYPAIGNNEWAAYMQTATVYAYLNQPDSAIISADKSIASAIQNKSPATLLGYSYEYKGDAYVKKRNFNLAFKNYTLALEYLIEDPFSVQEVQRQIAKMYMEMNDKPNAEKYALLAYEGASKIVNPNVMIDVCEILYTIYEPQSKEKAYPFLKTYQTLKDEIFSKEKYNQTYQIEVNEKRKEAHTRQAIKDAENKAKENFFMMILGFLTLIASVLGYFIYQKQKANKQLQIQKDTVESTLKELKSTQAQLIQSEKLASLGELTAGIAHEIQNPLNFVNNFSELSVDMAKELKEEIKKAEKDWALIEELADDLTTNQEKINHHGKRASNIVSGMLQHARTSTGKKEPTDLNALADEYLRLSYHGLRAKDSSFNATMETHFDAALPKIEVIPQDIGRVLLNLINNAFYAVNEKAKQGIEGYQPTVTVSTCKLDAAIEIKVQDNGNGIPDAIKEKIFQPFFTTKPTGQGTGLGLSLAYDIVVKGHRGKLEVESTEGEGTEFMVKLPI